MGEAGRGDRCDVGRVDDRGSASGERGVHDLIGRDHSRPVERVGHVRGRPQERPADAAVADRLLAGPVHGGDRVGRVVSDAAHGQFDDPLHARLLRRGDETVIVCGDVEPVGEQEHGVHIVQHGCQVAVCEIGHDLLGAVGETAPGLRVRTRMWPAWAGRSAAMSSEPTLPVAPVIKIMSRGPLLVSGFRGEVGVGAAPAGGSCAPRRDSGLADFVWRL